jgi:hypothetical protein
MYVWAPAPPYIDQTNHQVKHFYESTLAKTTPTHSLHSPEIPIHARTNIKQYAIFVYHVNIISAGFNATGKKKWLTTTVHSG